MKASMAGQKIGMKNRISSAYYIFRSYNKGIFGNAVNDIGHHKMLLGMIPACFGHERKNVKILDIGCGQIPKQIAMFKADGFDTVGIDMEVPTPLFSVSTLVRSFKSNGFERAIKSAARNILFDKMYRRNLSHNYGVNVTFHDLDIRVMSATEMSFDDDYFQFVFSDAVFEHIDNVNEATIELNRVLDKDGLARISIHLFPSISGGHHLEWIHPDTNPSRVVPPWDHLLDGKFKVNTYLNRHRLADYREIFGRYLQIVSEELRTEGAGLLTPQIAEILERKGFTRDDLLTRAVVFTCRKRLY
jgi:SAM-dependent methyltransferase